MSEKTAALGKGEKTEAKPPISELIAEYLKKNHRGEESAILSKYLERQFHISGTDLRYTINALRCAKVPICSCPYGYYYAENQHEIDATVAQLGSRISSIAKARQGLRGCRDFYLPEEGAKNAIYLLGALSLKDIGRGLDRGEQLQLAPLNAPEQTVRFLCPHCGKPISQYRATSLWFEARNAGSSGSDLYEDEDAICLPPDSRAGQDSSATLHSMHCPHCEEDCAAITLFCFRSMPEDGRAAVPLSLTGQTPMRMLYGSKGGTMSLVNLGDETIGVAALCREGFFRRTAFGGYTDKDFNSDAVMFALGNLTTETDLSASPYGVCNGRFDLNDTQVDWHNAELTALALARLGHEHMSHLT